MKAPHTLADQLAACFALHNHVKAEQSKHIALVERLLTEKKLAESKKQKTLHKDKP